MRVCLCPDLHIDLRTAAAGRDPEIGLNRRQIDMIDAFSRFSAKVVSTKADVVIFPGDFFHSNQPSWFSFYSAYRVLFDMMLKMPDTFFLFFDGNHDAPSSSVNSPLKALTYCLPPSGQSSFPEWRYVEDMETVSVSGFDFFIVPGRNQCIQSFQKILKDDSFKCDVVSGHFAITDTGIPYYGRQGIDLFSVKDLKGAFLGDLHIPFRRGNVFYSGALERTTFGEEGREVGFWLIDMTPYYEEWKAEFVPLDARRLITIHDAAIIDLSKQPKIILDSQRMRIEKAVEGCLVRYKGNDQNILAILREHAWGLQHEPVQVGQVDLEAIRRKTGKKGRSIVDLWNDFASSCMLDEVVIQKGVEFLKKALTKRKTA